MNILLTNDDGYQAEGLKAVIKKLTAIPELNIKVCAPLGQKSGVSHGITLFKPMKYIKTENGYAVDGTPVDCVKTALFGFYCDIKFDLIISGINKGMNMGHDIFYSGTVAGAREALINNISGIACSKKCNWDQKEIDYSNCAEFIAETIKDLKEEIISKRILLNINFPLSDNFKGIKITHLGDRIYDDTIYYSEENGVSFVSIVGNSVTHMNNKGSDLDIINNNYISITPLVETKESVNLMLKDKLSQIYN